MKAFPQYTKVEDVKCFNCDFPVSPFSVVNSGNAPRCGEYRARCAKCGMLTYFDFRRSA